MRERHYSSGEGGGTEERTQSQGVERAIPHYRPAPPKDGARERGAAGVERDRGRRNGLGVDESVIGAVPSVARGENAPFPRRHSIDLRRAATGR